MHQVSCQNFRACLAAVLMYLTLKPPCMARAMACARVSCHEKRPSQIDASFATYWVSFGLPASPLVARLAVRLGAACCGVLAACIALTARTPVATKTSRGRSYKWATGVMAGIGGRDGDSGASINHPQEVDLVFRR